MLALVSAGVVVWYGSGPALNPAYTIDHTIYACVVGFEIWVWIVALLGLARRYLARTNRFLQYASAASFSVYFLHFYVMVPIGYVVVQWRTGAVAEWAILTVLSLAACLIGYEILVRRTRVTRFLFGTKG